MDNSQKQNIAWIEEAVDMYTLYAKIYTKLESKRYFALLKMHTYST